ncbi:hypothetical protein BOQ63_001505 (plasmid) [Streptomyces viridifaciens]|nr:hypothetical protein BOQ63_001505 [Streptomyces viridifaciens]
MTEFLLSASADYLGGLAATGLIALNAWAIKVIRRKRAGGLPVLPTVTRLVRQVPTGAEPPANSHPRVPDGAFFHLMANQSGHGQVRSDTSTTTRV